ncbi:response regulator [Luteimonas aquatica]|uniref:response regulator n=1 Tax=Luteimonas aquatica TaxID=450364 RepID=UPI001F59F4D0|nr:response regulator transcription factor [Luteimonas aquatica]
MSAGDAPLLSTVLVADDHPMFRAAMLHAIAGLVAEGGVVEVASQSALEAAVAAAPRIDLVLLDLTMPGALGFSSLMRLRSERPEVPLIVVSSNDHPRTVRRAQQFGAAGFVSKAAPAQALREAVRAVMAGGTWFALDQAEGSEQDARLAAGLAQLTPQQFRVLMLLAEGLLNKQIAAELGLAENTVKIHVTAILAKLQCRSRTQAAVLLKTLDLEELQRD